MATKPPTRYQSINIHRNHREDGLIGTDSADPGEVQTVPSGRRGVSRLVASFNAQEPIQEMNHV